MLPIGFFFLEKGTVRSFYQKDYKEINTEFFFENDFFTAFTSFLSQEKTNLHFQCIEHLCNLNKLPAENFTFTAAPPKFKGVGTFPVRAFASVEKK